MSVLVDLTVPPHDDGRAPGSQGPAPARRTGCPNHARTPPEPSRSPVGSPSPTTSSTGQPPWWASRSPNGSTETSRARAGPGCSRLCVLTARPPSSATSGSPPPWPVGPAPSCSRTSAPSARPGTWTEGGSSCPARAQVSSPACGGGIVHRRCGRERSHQPRLLVRVSAAPEHRGDHPWDRHGVTDACDLAVSGSGRGPINHRCCRVTVHWSSRRDPQTKTTAA